NQFFGILNIFSGGALSNLSIVMLGLGPYITATIILQLFTLIFPKMKELYQESGEDGRRKFNQYGRMLTVPLAALQGYSLIVLFSRQGIITIEGPLTIIGVLASIVAGSLFLMWLGELVSERGIGNGISLLIFAGIIASVPLALREALISGTQQDLPRYLLFSAISLAIIMGVIMVNEARRNIPVSYAKRVRGTKLYGGATTYLPLTLNPAGVIPIIFALSLLLFPGIIGSFLATSSNSTLLTIADILNSFTNNIGVYAAAYFTLVVFFTYMYTAVTFNPTSIAENLQRQGGFIPGIRPGEPTAERITFILNRTLLIGAVFLGFIAIVPALASGGLQGGTQASATSFIIGGTSVLIVVSAVLETMRQIRAQVGMRQYE
ncbi:MAG: preprotein translocase subunit SecY, partial [Candidatus Spechtbacterales bacterium]